MHVPADCPLLMQDKIQMHLDRMYLLLQRLRRNKNFSRPAFAGLKASSRGFIEVRKASHALRLSLQDSARMSSWRT